jgi:peptidoglycan/LPS O-acetylase OafA/YrhL
MDNNTSKEKYFHNLDALRFIAFLGVFFSHAFHWQATSQLAEIVKEIVTINYFGVPFFFTLSSFLITYTLLGEKIKHGNIHLLKFYFNRGLRIWPVYFFILLFYFFILPQLAGMLHLTAPTLAPITPFILFYVNFYIIHFGSNFSLVLLILWSISIEEQFYFFWGMAFKWIKITQLVYILVCLFLLSIVFSYYYLFGLKQPENNLAIHTFYVVQNFFTGALLAWLYLAKKEVVKKYSKFGSSYLSLVFILLPLAYLLIDRNMVLLNIIKSICFAVIIYDQALNPHRLFNLGKFSFVNYLGKISYGLYIYHAFVIICLAKIFHFFDNESQLSFTKTFIQLAITFSITVVIAHLSYRYFELKFLAKKIHRKTN